MSDQLARQVENVEVTDEQRAAALELLEQEPHLGHVLALRRSGVAGTKGQLGTYVDEHPEFVDDADQARGKRIRTELLRRAIEGVEKGIWHNGKLVGTEIEYSDRLAEFVARMYLPEAKALRNGALEVTGPDGGPVKVNTQHGVSLTDVAALLVRVGALPPPGISSDGDRKALPAAPPLLAEPLPED